MIQFVPVPGAPVPLALKNWAIHFNKPIGELRVKGFRPFYCAKFTDKYYLTEGSPQGIITIEKLYGIKLVDIRKEGDIKWLSQGSLPERWV